MSHLRDHFLDAARTGLALLGDGAVAAAWDKASALEGFTVGGLAAHLATQVIAPAEVLDLDFTTRPRKTLYEHFFEAPWLDGDLDSTANTAVRDGGELRAADGPDAVRAAAAEALAVLEDRLPGLASDALGGNVRWPYATSYDEFLTTRVMELVVHADDLAYSVGIDTPVFAQGPFDLATAVLARLAAHRHGQAALVRALARSERAPDDIAGL